MFQLSTQFFLELLEHFFLFEPLLKFDKSRSSKKFLDYEKTPNVTFGSDGSIKSKKSAPADVCVHRIGLKHRAMFLFIFVDRYDYKQA